MIKGRNIHRDTMSVCSNIPMDLSGTAETSYLFLNTKRDVRINSLNFYYTEESSADTGVSVQIGIPGDTDSVYDYTTEESKSAGYTKTIDRAELSSDTVTAGNPILLTNAGSKSGDGEVIVSINYTVL